jgi:hypothetical protein
MRGQIASNDGAADGDISVLNTPASASKTFNAGFFSSAGTATLAALSDSPAFIMVELV